MHQGLNHLTRGEALQDRLKQIKEMTRNWCEFFQWRRGGARNNQVKGYREICSLCIKSSCPSHECHSKLPSWLLFAHKNIWSQSKLNCKRKSMAIYSFWGCQVPLFLLRQAAILPFLMMSHALLLPKCLLLLHRLCRLHPSIKRWDLGSLLQVHSLLP